VFSDGDVIDFPFLRHNAPPFRLMLQFCQSVDKYLNESSGTRAVAVHCKVGKARTGVLIAAYLLYSKAVATAEDALLLFARERTVDTKGVVQPSQVRYVRYFERFLKNYLWMDRPLSIDGVVLTLQHIRFTTVPQFDINGGCEPFFICIGAYPFDNVIYDHYAATKGKLNSFQEKSLGHCDIPCGDKNVQLSGDVKLVFFDKEKSAKNRMFACWINTAFIQDYYVCLTKDECDSAYKDKNPKHFDSRFRCELFFKQAAQ